MVGLYRTNRAMLICAVAMGPISITVVGCHQASEENPAQATVTPSREQSPSGREWEKSLALLRAHTRARSSAARFKASNTDVRLHVPSEESVRAAKPAQVALPTVGSGSVRVEDVTTGAFLAFSLRGAKPVSVVLHDAAAVYPNVLGSGTHSIHRGHAEGVEDWVVFSDKPDPEKLVYDVDVPARGGLRLVSSTLEILDESGVPRLRVAAPYGVDREGKPIDVTLSVGSACSIDTSPYSPIHRAIPAPCSSPTNGRCACEIIVQWHAAPESYPVAVDPAWTTTGSMAHPRWVHAANLWYDAQGRAYVLVTGGTTDTPSWTEIKATELYDIATGVWMMAADMNVARSNHRAVFLQGDGRVLVLGGQIAPTHEKTAGAEIYDGQWTSVQDMMVARCQPTATLLSNGTVLVAGGTHNTFDSTDSAEIFDPAKGWRTVQSMHEPRQGHSALALPGNKVLVIGGNTGDTTSVERYDVQTDTWTLLEPTAIPREIHSAHLLPNGDVLVVGGRNDFSDPSILAGTERLPSGSDGPWLPGPAILGTRYWHGGVTFNDGTLFIAGGRGLSKRLATAEILLPDLGVTRSLPAGRMNEVRVGATATLLPDGRVLVTGGDTDSGLTATAELFERQPPLAACTDPGECISGTCADGICCDTYCEGKCRTCDGGTCAPVEPNPCIPFACSDAGTCRETCQSSSDCAIDHVCIEGNCMFAPGGVKECSPNPCGAYRCTLGKPCPTSCSSNAHCADGFRCTEGQCVRYVPPVEAPAGCACSTAATPRNGLTFATIVAVFAAGFARRTRRSKG